MTFDLPRTSTQTLISGTDSFRTSSRKVLSNKRDTEYNNFGGNLQNIEKSIREIYEADTGCKLNQRDQGGAEALIVAYLCRPGKYRKLFENNIKPHTYLGFKIFVEVWLKHFTEQEVKECIEAPIDDLNSLKSWKAIAKAVKESDNWSSNERYYHFGKKTVHGGSYGMKENTFRTAILKESGGQIVISFEQASKMLKGFHMEFPEIQNWHMRTYEMVKKNNQLRNLFGFPYNITTFVKDSDFKDLIAWVPQSTVACITRNAVNCLYEYIEANNKDWIILGDCHDSYLAQCPEAEIEELNAKMGEFMEVEMISPFDGVKFRMKSEGQSGYNWRPYKEGVNEGGLR